MKAIPTKVGNTTLYIEATSETIEVLGGADEGRRTIQTGTAEDMAAAYASAKETLKQMAADLGNDFSSIASAVRPKKVEVEFNLALSASTGIWVITAKGECALKIKLAWELGE